MLKKIIILIITMLLVTGCNTKIEEEKNEYLDIKSKLETKTEFTEKDNLPCDITISLERVNEENIKYQVLFSNPKEKMDKIKLLIIHNQYTEDVFPSIGLIDKNHEKLLNNSNNNQELIINGTLNTTNDIDNLKLEFRIWLEYQNNNSETKDIYYKTTI